MLEFDRVRIFGRLALDFKHTKRTKRSMDDADVKRAIASWRAYYLSFEIATILPCDHVQSVPNCSVVDVLLVYGRIKVRHNLLNATKLNPWH